MGTVYWKRRHAAIPSLHSGRNLPYPGHTKVAEGHSDRQGQHLLAEAECPQEDIPVGKIQHGKCGSGTALPSFRGGDWMPEVHVAVRQASSIYIATNYCEARVIAETVTQG